MPRSSPGSSRTVCEGLSPAVHPLHVEDGHRDRRYRRRNTPQAAAATSLTTRGLPQGQWLEATTPHHLAQPAGASSQHGSRGSSTDRPPQRRPLLPQRRPEPAPADDGSHRRVDGAASRVRARISMMRSQTP